MSSVVRVEVFAKMHVPLIFMSKKLTIIFYLIAKYHLTMTSLANPASRKSPAGPPVTTVGTSLTSIDSNLSSLRIPVLDFFRIFYLD